MAVSKVIKEKELPIEHERFCQVYVSKEHFGSGVDSYMEVYGVKYNSAKVGACLLLKRPEIARRINELLDEAGLSDNFVDKQLLFLITQQHDLAAKVAAIREYNKLRQRVIEKVDITSNGNELSTDVTYNVIVTGKMKTE